MIRIAEPIIGAGEIRSVNEVLSSGILAQGQKVAALESAFAKYCGVKFAIAVNSGTAAIHSALFAAGIGPGDEVITTPLSFIATINPILFLGAKPVLVDIEPNTYNIDVKKISRAITKKTKAILPVDLYGQPCDFQELQALAKKYGLKIIEDACQGVGATYKNKKAGSLGDLGCFSLYATKNIMSGEGGVVTTNNEKYANTIKSFRQHGMTGPYEYEGIGYNYRMTDLQAAIAVEQTKKIDKFNTKRQQNSIALSKGLAGIKGIVLPKTAPNRTHVFHQYTIKLTKEFPLKRSDLIEALAKKGIGSGIYYPKPLHAYSHIASLGYKNGDFPESELAAANVISLPVHPKLKQTDITKIVSTFRELASA